MTAAAMATIELPPPRRQRMRAATPAVWFVALVVIALMLGPVLYIILGGFRTNSQITTDPGGLPNPWVWTNYLDVLTGGVFWQLVLNSTIVGVATTLGVIVLGLMASYVLARYKFRGRGALYALFAAGLMFPIVVAVTPLYIVVRDLGLINNLGGVILPQIAFGLPTTIIILVPFLRGDSRRDRGGRVHRRLQPPRLLLAHGAAPRSSGGHHGRHPRVRRQLEQLPAATVPPQRQRELHACRSGCRPSHRSIRSTLRRCSPSPRCR